MSRIVAVLVLVVLVGAASPAAVSSQAEPTADAGEPTEVLVKLADGGGLLGLGGVDVADLPGVDEVVTVIDGIDVHVASVPAGTADAVAATLQALPTVAYAEPNTTLTLSDAPNDPRLDEQDALRRIDAVEGWQRYRDALGEDGFPATGGAKLAVLDSGIDATLHAEFDGKIVECRAWLLQLGQIALPTCQDNNVHGTHVSGIAAAIADNGVGIAGVGFDAELMALQTCTLTCTLADVAAALVFAADNGANVANMSFGGPGSDALADAVGYAHRAEVLLVAAAGNDGEEVDYPAAYDEVMAVSATDADDDLAAFSSRGPEIEVAAPGENVLSTLPTGLLYGELSGTSMAAPHVAGLGALLMSLGADAEEARSAIAAGADDLGLPSEHQGAGRINVADSIDALTGP